MAITPPGSLGFAQLDTAPAAPPAGYCIIYSKTDNVLYLKDSSGLEVPLGTASGITSLTGDVTATGPGAAAAVVAFVGGKTAAEVAASINMTDAATSVNFPLTLVKRDASGNFSAGIITANLTGLASGNVAKAGDTMSGALNMGGNQIKNMADPSIAQDATTKKYVDDGLALKFDKTGGILTGAVAITDTSSAAFVVDGDVFVVDASNNRIGINKYNPTEALDVVGNGKFSGTIVASNFSGSLTGTNTGDVTVTDSSEIDLTITGQDLTAILKPTTVSANSYGSVSQVAVFTVDSKGRLTSASNAPIAVTSSQVTDFNEAAQDAVGGILTDTTSVDLTYNDAGNTISATVLPAGVDHDSLQNFVANEHIDHSAVSISAGTGLTGGGDITASRTISMPSVGTAGTKGSASQVPVFTTDAQGRVTGSTDTAISITSSQTTDFTEAAQDAVGLALTDTATIDFTYDDAGNQIKADVKFADSTIDSTASGIRVAPLSLTNAQIALAAAIAYSKLNLSNSIVNADIAAAAAIAYAKLDLVNSVTNNDIAATAAIVYSKLNLTNSIVNADIAAAAAIAYSKLNLALSIVNGDISASAAIAYSKLNLSNSIVNADIASAAAILRNKLASGSAWRVLINNASGVMDEAAAITANRALISDTNGIPTHSITTATELSYVNGVTGPIQSQINSITAAAITNEFYVDKSGNDTTGTGSILKPFLTVQRAANAVGTATDSTDYNDPAKRFYSIRIMNGVYTENVTLGTRLIIVMDFNSAQLVGDVTINFNKGIAAPATIRQPKYVFKDSDLRPSFTGSNMTLTGVNGNINFNYINAGSSVTCQIHLLHTGVSGNIVTALGTGGTNNGTLQVYGTEAYITGQVQITTNTGSGAVFFDSMGDDTVGLGGVTGNCTLQSLRNVRFSGVVNVARNQTGAQWYNVSFLTGSSLTGSSGSISVDANSYQSYFTNVTTKGSETFNFIDNARAVAYNPTTPADWAATPATVMAGLDSAASRLAAHASRHLPSGADPLATAAPITSLDANTSNSVGTANSLARSDHSHDILTGVPVTQTPDQANAEGTSVNLARADHVHNIPADVVVNIGSANAEGTSTSFARADHVHNIQTATGILNTSGTLSPDYAVPVTQTPDQINSTGTSNKVAMADHVHNIPTDAPTTTLSPVTPNSKGTGTSFARNDHTHAIATASTIDITGIQPDDTANAGSASNYARGDHRHAIAAGSASTQTPDQINAEGTSTSFARADHVHNIPSGPVVQIGTSNFAGSASSFALSDHSHSHGNQTSGSLHAIATTLVNGFMSFLDKVKLDLFSGTTPTDTQILIADGTQTYKPKTVSGDVTLSNTGASTIQSNVVSNSKLAQMPASTIKGNNTGASANPLDLTATQTTAMLDVFVGDSGLGGVKGLVPAPAAGDTMANKFLKADGTFSTTSAAGSLAYFFTDSAADVATYLYLDGYPGGATQYVTDSAPAHNNTIQSWVTLIGNPNTSFIPAGSVNIHIHGYKTGGTKTVALYAEVYKRSSGGIETLLVTTGNTIPLTNTEADLPAVNASFPDIILNFSDRIVIKVKESITGGGSHPSSITVGFAGATAARIEVPAAAASAITSLSGDVSATGPGASAAIVNSVGGKTSSAIATSVNDTQAATPSNAPSTIVQRDSSGNFSAGQITANLTGNATNVTGIVAIANGGTNANTVPAARVNLGIDKRTTFNNANYTVLSTDVYIGQIGTLTSSRTVTLPLANSVNPGYEIIITDESGSVSLTNFITILAAGGNTINGASSENIQAPYGFRRIISNGSSAWTFDGGVLRSSHNLADLQSASTARTNLGLANSAIIASTSSNTPSTIVQRDSSGLTELTTEQLNGSISGSIQLKAADTTTSYAIKMPPAQGAAGTYLNNDGSGNLSWSSPLVNIDGGRPDSVFVIGANVVGGTP
jgi:hypothetical protein